MYQEIINLNKRLILSIYSLVIRSKINWTCNKILYYTSKPNQNDMGLWKRHPNFKKIRIWIIIRIRILIHFRIENRIFICQISESRPPNIWIRILIWMDNIWSVDTPTPTPSNVITQAPNFNSTTFRFFLPILTKIEQKNNGMWNNQCKPNSAVITNVHLLH